MSATTLAVLLDRLTAGLGADAVLRSPESHAPYLRERRGRFYGRAAAVVRPMDTAGVAHAIRACAQAGVGVVPQGGNTGLCGGAAPDPTGTQILLSLERLNRIRAIDPADYTMTAEAGCILAQVQAAAAAEDRLFPLSYAAERECRIGGNLATNAGGMNVLRYGNARDLVLGLEVVLADGRIWNGLRRLRKDNSGYDLKNLFIGAEGTLGVITAAVLRLFPAPRHRAVALLGLERVEQALALLERLRSETGDTLSAFELIGRTPMDFALRHGEGCRMPFAATHPWYVVLEMTSSRSRDDPAALLASALTDAHRDGQLREWHIATEPAQRDALWRLRKAIPGAQRHEGASIKHDVSVPVSRVPELIRRATEAVETRLPGVRPCVFGHVGDGNMHFNLSQPPEADGDAFLARWDEFNRLLHDLVTALGGSFAAEHGIGQLKTAEVARLKSPVEVDLMRRLKSVLDPANILNPGKVIPPSGIS